MSSTGRGAKRAANDFYPTPHWCVHRLLEQLHEEERLEDLAKWTWLDPAAGEGDLRDATISGCHNLGVTHPSMDLSDKFITEHSTSDTMQRDFLSMSYTPDHDVIFTNPPFSLAMEFVEKALSLPGREGLGAHVFMLLHSGFAASAKRNEFIRETQPSVYLIPDRPSFTGFGADSCDYAWFEWSPWSQPGTFRVLKTTPQGIRQNDPVTLRMRARAEGAAC